MMRTGATKAQIRPSLIEIQQLKINNSTSQIKKLSNIHHGYIVKVAVCRQGKAKYVYIRAFVPISTPA